MVSAVDTFIWQSLASVMIPGQVIYAMVRLSKMALMKGEMRISQQNLNHQNKWKQNMYKMFLNKKFLKFSPTVFGLFLIPFIIHPIDKSVDLLMNEVVRKHCYTI